MTFEEGKRLQAIHEREVEKASKALKGFECHPNGLVVESVRLSPAYRKLKANFDSEFRKLRAFNSIFVKMFKKELRDERRNRNELRGLK